MAHKKDPETGKPSQEAMISVICIGALASPLGQLWFAWTCEPPIHWIWPVLAGILFGRYLIVNKLPGGCKLMDRRIWKYPHLHLWNLILGRLFWIVWSQRRRR